MTASLYHPDLYFGVAFNANPNDATAVPVWRDLTNKVTKIINNNRGRVYELAQTLAAAPTVTFRDPEEALNPANTGSPYYPDVRPYRAILGLAQWPNGGTGNLLNSGTWRGNKIDAFDPSFESYANGAAAPNWTAPVNLVGTPPSVTNANAWQGTKSLTWAVGAFASPQGVSWSVPCIPGRQYTSSAYVRQTTASTQRIEIDGTTFGTTTVATGAYVRLTVTFTATQPQHTCRVVNSGLAVAGTVNLDALQHEQTAAASAFTTTGPVIYPLLRDLVERWPRVWSASGFEGWCEAPCVDPLAAIAAITLKPELIATTLSLRPRFYYQLNDGVTTVGFTDTSGNHQPPLLSSPSRYGVATPVVPQTAIDIPGLQDLPDAVGVGFSYVGSSGSTKQGGTALSTGLVLGTPRITVPSAAEVAANTWALTATAWVQLTATSDTWQTLVYLLKSNSAAPGSPGVVPLRLSVSSTQVRLSIFNATASISLTTAVGTVPVDGQVHLVTGIVSVAAGVATLTVYVDADFVVGIPAAFTLGASADILTVGANADPVNFYEVCKGTVAQVALFDRALTQDEVLSIARAGIEPGIAETPNYRTQRHLALGGYAGATRISSSPLAPFSTMQPPTWSGSIDLLTDAQNNTLAESGCMWVAPDGAFVAESRRDRYLRLTPLYTLGENSAGGELPYGEGISYDYDPFFVYPDVAVSREGGATAIGGVQADIEAARLAYFPRSYAATTDLETDQQAQDLADWTFATHRAPVQRVSEIEFNPVGNPALWPFCLGAEVGQRVRVVRRAKAANAGAGITMSADFFIERVSQPVMDRISGEWLFRFLLSPVGTAPGPTVQPWILGDTTHSVLGTTTIPGY